jgi:hypothetical protein
MRSVYSFQGLTIFLLLFICSSTYIRQVPRLKKIFLSEKRGFWGTFYKGTSCSCTCDGCNTNSYVCKRKKNGYFMSSRVFFSFRIFLSSVPFRCISFVKFLNQSSVRHRNTFTLASIRQLPYCCFGSDFSTTNMSCIMEAVRAEVEKETKCTKHVCPFDKAKEKKNTVL